jgi:putative transposase
MRFFQPLLARIAASTHQGLAAQVDYLKSENRVLRGKLPKRSTVTPAERERLVAIPQAALRASVREWARPACF